MRSFNMLILTFWLPFLQTYSLLVRDSSGDSLSLDHTVVFFDISVEVLHLVD